MRNERFIQLAAKRFIRTAQDKKRQKLWRRILRQKAADGAAGSAVLAAWTGITAVSILGALGAPTWATAAGILATVAGTRLVWRHETRNGKYARQSQIDDLYRAAEEHLVSEYRPVLEIGANPTKNALARFGLADADPPIRAQDVQERITCQIIDGAGDNLVGIDPTRCETAKEFAEILRQVYTPEELTEMAGREGVLRGAASRWLTNVARHATRKGLERVTAALSDRWQKQHVSNLEGRWLEDVGAEHVERILCGAEEEIGGDPAYVLALAAGYDDSDEEAQEALCRISRQDKTAIRWSYRLGLAGANPLRRAAEKIFEPVAFRRELKARQESFGADVYEKLAARLLEKAEKQDLLPAPVDDNARRELIDLARALTQLEAGEVDLNSPAVHRALQSDS